MATGEDLVNGCVVIRNSFLAIIGDVLDTEVAGVALGDNAAAVVVVVVVAVVLVVLVLDVAGNEDVAASVTVIVGLVVGATVDIVSGK